jgi:hypothetical protein
MMVRAPGSTASSGDNVDVGYVPDNTAASGGAAAPANADGSREAELIRNYFAEEGLAGPRRLFSAVNFETFLRLGETYDDNILLSSQGPRHSDVITSIGAGARLSLGDFADRVNTFAILGYTGVGELFARNGSQDDYNQDAIVDLYYHPHEVAVGSTSRFEENHDATADLGVRTDRDMYAEDVSLKYFRNSLTTLGFNVHYEYDHYSTPIDTSDLTFGPTLDYALTPKITVGAGVGAERLTATGGVETYSEQAQLRFGYAVTHLVDLSASFGLEYLESNGTDGDSLTPIFSVTGTWNPTAGATLNLEAHRRTEASGALYGEEFLSTGLTFGYRQELLKRFYLRLDLGFENASYTNVTLGESQPRSDNYYSVRTTAGYEFVRWLQIQAFFERRQDLSTDRDFSFTSDRVGCEVSLTY